MLRRKEKPKFFKDITIPKVTTARKVIYFDESGEEKMPQIPLTFNSPDRYFIYTATIFNDHDVRDLEHHYFNIKRKYLGRNIPIHSTEFFVNQTKKKSLFVRSLAEFIDTLPFLYITVIVDKKSLFDISEMTTVKRPLDTTLKKALAISLKQGLSDTEFYEKSIKDILKIISSYSFKNISNYYPLELAYKAILDQYFNEISPIYFKGSYKDSNKIIPFTEFKFETSPNKERVMKLTDRFKSNQNAFGEILSQSLYDVSFPYKKAKYMGLEIADIISYGYHLEKDKLLTQRPLYQLIRRVVLRRNRIQKKELGLDSVIEKKKRG